MRIHVLQHAHYEDPAYIREWVSKRGHELARTRLYEGEPFPDHSSFEWLVIMGGPMGVHDDASYPWLIEEKRFIDACVGAEKTVLGICLGAQMIADTLGARVFKNEHIERGWHEIALTAEAGEAPAFSGLPECFEAFLWHGDAFEVPAGAAPLAQSKACENQAFAFGENVVGLQFHLEPTPASIAQLIENSGSVEPGPFVQEGADALIRPKAIARVNRLMDVLLDNLAGMRK